jgi:histidine ammonia-lyase
MAVEIGKRLEIGQVVQVALFNTEVTMPPDVEEKIETSRRLYLEALRRGEQIYGVTTSLGELVKVKTTPSGERILLEHAAGVGEVAPREWVRAALLIRAHQLALGYSGVRTKVVKTLVELLNKDITPAVPRYGSVGASGDLAQLSHIALTLIGRGYVLMDGVLLPAEEALKRRGIEPLDLDPREALALINGTSFSTAVLALAVWRTERLIEKYLETSALFLYAVGANWKALAKETQVKRHPGIEKVAGMLECVGGGKRLNDPYSIRCIPQIMGAVYDSVGWVRKIVEDEINSPSDNPIILPSGSRPTCHFHGQHIAIAADVLAIALAAWANLVERQTAQLLRGEVTGKPDFLATEPGSVGDMIYQYTAASLAAKIRALASPHSIHNIPTSGLQEDVNSMSLNAAVRLHDMLNLLRHLLSIHLVVSLDATNCADCPPKTAELYQRLKSLTRGKIPSERIEAAGEIWY